MADYRITVQSRRDGRWQSKGVVDLESYEDTELQYSWAKWQNCKVAKLESCGGTEFKSYRVAEWQSSRRGGGCEELRSSRVA